MIKNRNFLMVNFSQESLNKLQKDNINKLNSKYFVITTIDSS